MKILKYMVLNILLIGLVACGESGVSNSNLGHEGEAGSFKVDVGEDIRVEFNVSIVIVGSVIKNDDTNIISYLWTKENEVLSTKVGFLYTPTTVGKETLTLTAKDSKGVTASDSIELTVYRLNEVPVVNAGKDVVIAIDENITLVGKAIDSDGVVKSYVWARGNEVLSTDMNFTYVPKGIGEEHFTLSVTDDDGAVSMDTVKVTVTMRPFITTWKTDNSGYSRNDEIRIATEGEGFNYRVDWGDGEVDNNVSGSIMHKYKKESTYRVKISGDFPRIYFRSNYSDSEKILSIEQWGDIEWLSMKGAFAGTMNMKLTAKDTPDLSRVTDMSMMFAFINNDFNLNDWNVSTITNMHYCFGEGGANPKIDAWDVSNVVSMSHMFYMNWRLSDDIGGWDISDDNDISYMFSEAEYNCDYIRHWKNYTSTDCDWNN